MKNPAISIVLCAAILSIVSCKKDNNSTNTQALNGDWNFMGLHAITSSTATDNESGDIFSDVTTSEYTTTDNGGTVNISGNTMTGNGIKYSANDTTLLMEYENNVFVDSTSSIINFSVPPTSSTSTFEQVGADSLHFTGQGLFAGGSGPAATGARFTISGNILTLTMNAVVDQTQSVTGVTITQHETANIVVILQKQ